jgi:hypothetical protein
MQHLSQSLSKLSQALADDENHPYDILAQASICRDDLGNFQSHRMRMLLKKLGFPYELCTSLDALREWSEIPPLEKFYSSLIKDYTVTESERLFAQEVFDEFECQTMECFMMLYMKCDVYVTAEVIFTYRQKMLEFFELDPFKFISLPSLSFSGFLMKCNQPIEMITNKSQYALLEKNLRGGMSFVSTRWSQQTETSRIASIDANGLYCSVMTLPLPCSNYRFLTGEEISKIDFMRTNPFIDGGDSYLLIVDLHFPSSKCLYLSEMMLAPEHRVITEDQLSPYQLGLLERLEGTKKVKTSRLTASYHDRKDYLIHVANLQLFLSLGAQLKKIHAVFAFYQKRYGKKFMEDCLQKRAQSQNQLENMMWKLICNAIYGRFNMDVRGFMDCKVVTSEERARKLMSQSNYHSHKILSENMMFVFMKRRRVKLDCLILNSFVVLSYAKFEMYHMYYNYLKPLWPQNRILIHDTDSYILETQSPSLEKDLEKIKNKMDFSNLVEGHYLRNTDRKNAPFLHKLETKFLFEIKEVVALRSKCYALRCGAIDQQGDIEGNFSDIKKCKGIQRASVAKQLTFEDYKKALFEESKVFADFYRIRMKNFTIRTEHVKKLALSAADLKRYYFPCGLHSCPLGSPEILVFNGRCRHCLGLTPEQQQQRLEEWLIESKPLHGQKRSHE